MVTYLYNRSNMPSRTFCNVNTMASYLQLGLFGSLRNGGHGLHFRRRRRLVDPLVQQIGLERFKREAQLLNIFLNTHGSQGLCLLYERGDAGQVKRGQRLQQLPGRKWISLIGTGEIEHHPGPQIVLQMKGTGARACAIAEFADLRIRFGLESHGPDFTQVLSAAHEGVDHAVKIHFDRVQPDVKSEAVERHGFTFPSFLPNGIVFLHKQENATDDLLEHGAQVRTWILGVMQLSAEKALADAESLGNCDR